MKRKTHQFFVNLADLTGTRIDQWYIERVGDKFMITFQSEDEHAEKFNECTLQPGTYEFHAIIIPHSLFPRAVRKLKKLARKKPVNKAEPSDVLSDLQREILKLKDDSFTDKEVADKVHRSTDAVKKQLSRLYEKFHVRHRIGALLKKVRWKL